VYPTADSGEQEKHLMQVAANQEKMQKWAHHAPMNYQHKYDLVEAEKARVLGKYWEAADYYDKRPFKDPKHRNTSKSKHSQMNLQPSFICLATKTKSLKSISQNLTTATSPGARSQKSKILEARYPQLVAQTLNRETKTDDLNVTATKTSTNSDFSNALDIGTFIKASQAITSEIVLDKLLARLIKILLENTAAQKAVLMLYKDGNLFIQATCTAEENQADVLQSHPG
jgi:hypothetical protein